MNPTLEQVLESWPQVLGGLLLYLIIAVLAWKAARRLVPPPRIRLAAWGAFEVFLLLVSVSFLIPGVCGLLLTQTGLGEWLLGGELIKAAGGKGPDAKFAQMRLSLVAQALAFPFQLMTIPLILRPTSTTWHHGLGL